MQGIDLRSGGGLWPCLVQSLRVSLGFDSTGRAYQRHAASPDFLCEPLLVTSGRRVRFEFGGGEVYRPIDEQGH